MASNGCLVNKKYDYETVSFFISDVRNVTKYSQHLISELKLTKKKKNAPYRRGRKMPNPP